MPLTLAVLVLAGYLLAFGLQWALADEAAKPLWTGLLSGWIDVAVIAWLCWVVARSAGGSEAPRPKHTVGRGPGRSPACLPVRRVAKGGEEQVVAVGQSHDHAVTRFAVEPARPRRHEVGRFAVRARRSSALVHELPMAVDGRQPVEQGAEGDVVAGGESNPAEQTHHEETSSGSDCSESIRHQRSVGSSASGTASCSHSMA